MTSSVSYHRQLFAYEAWANQEALVSIRQAGAPEAAVRVMGHIAAGGRLWHARIHGQPSPLPVWPDLSLIGVAEQLDLGAAAWGAWLEGLVAQRLEDPVTYSNSRHETYTNSVRDILTHVSTHAAYHRGQVALLVRQENGTPAYVDFIHGRRQGLFEIPAGG